MPTTSEHIAARDDQDLRSRLVAAAEQAGVPNAAGAVYDSLGALMAAPISVNGEETSITAVHAYAAAVRREHLAAPQAQPPGLNPGAVTDAHLHAAIQTVIVAESPQEV
jgi:hypothetical protein